MMKLLVFFILSQSIYLQGQYIENFSISDRGILPPGCSGSELTSCSNTNFSDVEWSLGGDLSGIDSEGFFTQNGALFTADSDTRACWISPIIYIDEVNGTTSLTVDLSIPSTSTSWDSFSGSDYMDVEYSIDGGGFNIIPNVHGCLGNGHTISGIGCGSLSPGTNCTASATNLLGTELIIQVCIDANLSSEQGQINSVEVPEANATAILPVNFKSFSAHESEIGVRLDWVTSSERNNVYFSIERSSDGRLF